MPSRILAVVLVRFSVFWIFWMASGAIWDKILYPFLTISAGIVSMIRRTIQWDRYRLLMVCQSQVNRVSGY